MRYPNGEGIVVCGSSEVDRKRSCDLEKENRGTIFVGIDLSTRLEAGKPSQKLTGVGICTIHVRVFAG